MNCLDNYIGLKGCSEGTPASGLWINGLPGIPSDLFSKIATADHATYKNMWLDVQRTAQQQLITDVQRAFQSRYKLRSIARSINLKKDLDTTSTTAPAAVYRGFGINADSGLDARYTQSHFLGMSIDVLELYVGADPGEFDLVIYDGETGEEYYRTTLNSAGALLSYNAWNTIPVNRVFSTRHLRVAYDATGFTSSELTLPSGINQSLCSCICDWFDCELGSCPGSVYGLQTDDDTDLLTITSGTNSFGLTAKIGFVCSIEPLVCDHKKTFSRAFWYLCGYHTMFHALYTPTFSRHNTVDRKLTKELMDSLLSMYQDELKMVIDGINLNENDLCIECNSQVEYRFANPGC
jgi:hypothetical protein